MIDSIENGRLEAGNQAIADKIISRLHDLEKTIEINQGRWAWELLQNAKDSIANEDNRTVSIQIELNQEKIEFRHNGTHFSEQDIVGLISQISSKEVEEGRETKKTGRFGTGFLTTHLLSKVIQIKGIVETQNDGFHRFDFLLDRQGNTRKELIPKINKAWTDFQQSEKKIDSNYDCEDFNTSFGYSLATEEQKGIAKTGIDEFSRLLPFVLVFIPKISSIEIIDNIQNTNVVFSRDLEVKNELIIPITKIVNSDKSELLILSKFDKNISIAIEVEKSEKGYLIKNIDNIPKIFCDFPLIGTEHFYFPVVINSFSFIAFLSLSDKIILLKYKKVLLWNY